MRTRQPRRPATLATGASKVASGPCCPFYIRAAAALRIRREWVQHPSSFADHPPTPLRAGRSPLLYSEVAQPRPHPQLLWRRRRDSVSVGETAVWATCCQRARWAGGPGRADDDEGDARLRPQAEVVGRPAPQEPARALPLQDVRCARQGTPADGARRQGSNRRREAA